MAGGVRVRVLRVQEGGGAGAGAGVEEGGAGVGGKVEEVEDELKGITELYNDHARPGEMWEVRGGGRSDRNKNKTHITRVAFSYPTTTELKTKN